MQPKKSLGQNFLRDRDIVEKIISVVSPREGEILVEVGPGEGVLTERLAKSGAIVVAVELDDRLIPVLQEKFSKYENVHIFHGDILRMDIEKVLSDVIQDFSTRRLSRNDVTYRVVGNLPYYITSAIMRMFLEMKYVPKEAFFMMQKEVAERITAPVKKMSVLSVAVQFYAEVEVLFSVPKESFSPVPKVESAFVKLATRDIYVRGMDEKKVQDFFRTVKIGFSARRKTLVNNLANGFHLERSQVESLLLDIGIASTVRAQEISVEEWKKIAEKL